MSQITLDIDSETAKKLNKYIKSFGSKDLLFQKFIEFHKKKLKKEIARMQIDLNEFEQKYKISSQEFYKKFETGDYSDDRDYIIWAGLYEMNKESIDKLNQLS
ncbi:MAG: hypothetical protein K9H26_12170 [Prolixibacteraceae bacterium]|nr:hypothetical protein [Prolixibacteraceae bacterium]